MVMLNLDSKQVGSTVQMNIDIQGDNHHLQISADGATFYEAFGACLAKLMQEQPCQHDLKVTWVRSRSHPEEWTIVQKTLNGQPIDVRWGTNLFADLFAPVYNYLKNL